MQNMNAAGKYSKYPMKNGSIFFITRVIHLTIYNKQCIINILPQKKKGKGEAKMYCTEYSRENKKTIVMLHGANFVHSFMKQYELADRYHLVIPHLMGFGIEADKTFDAEKQVAELAELISEMGQKVTLVGFSLGAQVGYKLAAEHPELFNGAVLVSPWLCKDKTSLEQVMKANEKQYASFKKKWLCSFIGKMNGLSKEQRAEFVEQMQKVSIDTIRNSVDNGITLDSVHGFGNVDFPVIALCGGKEQDIVKNSIKGMSEQNPAHCTYEIWEKASHNIPPLYAEKFNEVISKLAK